MTEAEKYANDMLTMMELMIEQHCRHSSREAHFAAAKEVSEFAIKAIVKSRNDIASVYDLSFLGNDFYKDVLEIIRNTKK